MIVLYVFFATLLVIVTLLFIPLQFSARGQINKDLSLETTLVWAGGLVVARWRLPLADRRQVEVQVGPWHTISNKDKGREQPQTADESEAVLRNKPPGDQNRSRRGDSRRKSNGKIVWACLDHQVLTEICIFLSHIWQSLRLRCNLDGYYGTDDPASTAYLATSIALFKYCGRHPGINLLPRFDQEILNLSGDLQGRFIPGAVILDLGRFLLKRPIRKIWWTMLRENNHKR